MSAPMHTPGPWYVDCDYASGRQTQVRASASGGRDQLCIANAAQGAGDFVRLEANARLIAAAPELLAELEKAEDFMSGFEGCELQDGIDKRLASMRAAIAKAKGGAA